MKIMENKRIRLDLLEMIPDDILNRIYEKGIENGEEGVAESEKTKTNNKVKKPYSETLIESITKVIEKIKQDEGKVFIPLDQPYLLHLIQSSLDFADEAQLQTRHKALLQHYRSTQFLQKILCVAMVNTFYNHYFHYGRHLSIKDFCQKYNYNYDLTLDSIKFFRLVKEYRVLFFLRESLSTLMRNWGVIEKAMNKKEFKELMKIEIKEVHFANELAEIPIANFSYSFIRQLPFI